MCTAKKNIYVSLGVALCNVIFLVKLVHVLFDSHVMHVWYMYVTVYCMYPSLRHFKPSGSRQNDVVFE